MTDKLVLPRVKWDANADNLELVEPACGWEIALAPRLNESDGWYEHPCTTVITNKEHHADIVIMHPSLESGAVFRLLLLVAGKHGDIYEAQGYTEYLEDSDINDESEMSDEEIDAAHSFERHWPYAVNLALEARQRDYDRDQGDEGPGWGPQPSPQPSPQPDTQKDIKESAA